VNPLNTTIYTHPSDQERWENVRRLTSRSWWMTWDMRF